MEGHELVQYYFHGLLNVVLYPSTSFNSVDEAICENYPVSILYKSIAGR